MLHVSSFINLSEIICILLYVCVINCCFQLIRSSTFSFISQYPHLLLKLSISCDLLLPTPFTSIICPSMAWWRRQFILRIRKKQWTFLSSILFINVFFSTNNLGTSSLVNFSDHFIFCILLQNHNSRFSR